MRDVHASSRFYTHLLGAERGHGGDEYEQIVADGEIVLQLHRFDVDDHHGPLADQEVPLGNGTVTWFEVADFDHAVLRVGELEAAIVRDVELNPNAKQREIWIRDPDGYLVALAGPSEYRPR